MEDIDERTALLSERGQEPANIQEKQRQDEPASVKLKSGRRWDWKDLIACGCLWLTYFICSAAYSIIAPFFPEEAEERKGYSSMVTGVIISCSPLCVVVLSPVFGYFLPHFGTRFMISSGLLLIGGSFILLGFVDQLPSNWVFVLYCVLLRMTEGVGSAMFVTATFTVLPVLFPKSVATIMGLFEVAGGLGFALGPPLGGLLYQYGGFKLPFLSVGGFVLLFILPCTLLVKGNTSSSSSKPHASILPVILRAFTDLPFILLVIVCVLSLGCLAFFTPTMQPFLSKQFGLNPLKVGLVFLIGPLIYMFVALVVGPLSDRLGHRWFAVFGMALYGLGFFFVGPADFIAAPRLWITCVGFAVVGVAAAFSLIPPFADMLGIAKKYLKGNDERDVTALTAVVSGVVSSALSLGEFLGPLIGGALTSVYSFATSAVLIAEVLLAMAVLLLGVTLIERRTKS